MGLRNVSGVIGCMDGCGLWGDVQGRNMWIVEVGVRLSDCCDFCCVRGM